MSIVQSHGRAVPAVKNSGPAIALIPGTGKLYVFQGNSLVEDQCCTRRFEPYRKGLLVTCSRVKGALYSVTHPLPPIPRSKARADADACKRGALHISQSAVTPSIGKSRASPIEPSKIIGSASTPGIVRRRCALLHDAVAGTLFSTTACFTYTSCALPSTFSANSRARAAPKTTMQREIGSALASTTA